jgi:hypothetical protein
MRELINDLKEQLSEYTKLVEEAEAKGFYGASFEETETYGVFLGKKELLEDLIPKLEKFT